MSDYFFSKIFVSDFIREFKAEQRQSIKETPILRYDLTKENLYKHL